MADSDVCENCGLQIVTQRKTRGARVHFTKCGATLSAYYELRCKRLAVYALRMLIASKMDLKPGELGALLAQHWMTEPDPEAIDKLAALLGVKP